MNIGIILYENAQSMDIIGPWEVLGFWKNILGAPLHMFLISENGSYVNCVNDIVLKAHVDFTTCPKLDVLIIPGGPGRLKEIHNDKLITFIKNQAVNCKYVLSDCTGMFILYQTGLLKDKSATTYWRALPELKSLHNLNVAEERIVKSGNVWTAGGVSSGIDLALELIKEISGAETAGQVQLLFEYFPNHAVYTTLKTAASLPPYHGSIETHSKDVPKYIKDHIKKSK